MNHSATWALLLLCAAVMLAATSLLVRGWMYLPQRPWTALLAITRRVDHGNGWFTLTLRRPFPWAWMPLPRFKAGQSVAVSMAGNCARRHYSLARWSTRPREYELTIKPEPQGKLSPWLAQHALQGARLHVEGPSGSFTLGAGAQHHRQVLIAGGVGITPLLAMLDAWCQSRTGASQQLHFYWQTQFPTDWTYRDALAAHQASTPGLQVHLLASRTQDGTARRISVALLCEELGSLADTRFVLCAGASMMDDLCAGLEQAGVARSAIVLERFGTTSQAPAGSFTLQVDGMSVPFCNHRNLLEALEEARIPIASDCRNGTCGQCAMQLVQGQTLALYEAEHPVRPGQILACNCVPTGDLTLSLLSA